MEEQEERFYWLDFLFQEDNHEWDDFDEFGPWGIDWWDYPGSGSVHSMDEYHQMKVLTLLRKLGIGNARLLVKDRGW